MDLGPSGVEPYLRNAGVIWRVSISAGWRAEDGRRRCSEAAGSRVKQNIREPGLVDDKASMHDEAEACADAVVASGVSIAALKEAAGGDLEKFLVDRQNAFTDATGRRTPGGA